MIKLFATCLLTICAGAFAQEPTGNNYADAKILKYEFINDGLGSYSFAFDTSDGTHRDEEGELQDKGTEDESMVVHGSYSFTADDGAVYTVKYTADANGFHPEGDHFTVPTYVPWLKGQPHDDGRYRGEPDAVPRPRPEIHVPTPSGDAHRQVVTPKYIPALKKRNLSVNVDDAADDDEEEDARKVADIVADINKLV